MPSMALPLRPLLPPRDGLGATYIRLKAARTGLEATYMRLEAILSRLEPTYEPLNTPRTA